MTIDTSTDTSTGAARAEVGDDTWVTVCAATLLTPDRGVAALVHGRAVAVFALSTGGLHAIDNIDPCSGASVLSRGMIGDVDGFATVASPMYKQRFDLCTGCCLDSPGLSVAVHDVTSVGGMIHVRLRPVAAVVR